MLEGLTELNESFVFMVTVNDREMLKIKISQRKRRGQKYQTSGEVPNTAVVLSVKSESITLLASMCDSVHRALPAREVHPSLGTQSVY